MEKLESATARPRQVFDGNDLHQGLFAKVAALGHGIAANHCFGNGNKRTSFLAMTQALHANGWSWNPPPEVVAFVMLRIASNANRMQVYEIASFIGTYAFEQPKEPRWKHASDGLVARGNVTVDGEDIFPIPVSEPQDYYYKIAVAVFERHNHLISDDERAELARTFRWPAQVRSDILKWYNKEKYRKRYLRQGLQRKRTKRIGRRRCPHLGGRSVPKICRPITRKKMGYRTT